jgi:hypothetical protein
MEEANGSATRLERGVRICSAGDATPDHAIDAKAALINTGLGLDSYLACP